VDSNWDEPFLLAVASSRKQKIILATGDLFPK
jgi:hypothetical protein